MLTVTFAVEYEGGVRYKFAQLQCEDVDAAYRVCAKFLEARPRAHRVEAWDGGWYVTRATRGVPLEDGWYRGGIKQRDATPRHGIQTDRDCYEEDMRDGCRGEDDDR